MPKSKHTVNASAWTISGKLLGRLFDLALLLYLSRALSPADFGLIALAMAPIYIGEAVLELPLVQTLLRFQSPKKSMYDTAFTLSAMRSLALAILFIGLSYPLSQFYNEPRLMTLVCVLALAPIFRGTLSPYMVTFMKEMDFKREFLLEVFGKAMAFLAAIIVVSINPSYWAIAVATIVSPFAMNVLSYILAPYRPHLSLKAWPDFADMVGWTTLTQIISAINWQMDRLFLGHYITTEQLGQYSLANELVALPQRAFISPISNPLMAGFTLKTTRQSLMDSYLTSIGVIFIFIAPIFLTLSLLAEPLILILVGDKWRDAIPIVQWLAAFSILILPIAPLPALALSLNRTRLITLRMSIEFIVKLIAMVIGVYYYGIWGAIFAIGIANVVSFLITFLIVKKLIDLPVTKQLGAIIRPALALIIMAVVTYYARPESVGENIISDIIRLSMTVLSGISLYALSIYLIWKTFKKPDGAEYAIGKFLGGKFLGNKIK